MISSFKGDYQFLSNFYPCQVNYDGRTFQNAEAAFQSSKTFDKSDKDRFTTFPGNLAKYFGKRVVLRGDWDEVKDNIMYEVILAKFSQNEDLKEKLLGTGDKQLVEGNNWKDFYWGVCYGKGQNKLGKILMKVREELKQH